MLARGLFTADNLHRTDRMRGVDMMAHCRRFSQNEQTSGTILATESQDFICSSVRTKACGNSGIQQSRSRAFACCTLYGAEG